MSRQWLMVNSGSASVRATLFAGEQRRDWHLRIASGADAAAHEAVLAPVLDALDGRPPDAVGHRFVHGGDVTQAVRRIDAAEQARLESLVALAPLHLPSNLAGVVACASRWKVPQLACFDTAFHRTLGALATRLPLPAHFGIRRYGFHGLSYASVARRLPALLGDRANGRVVVAHLGSGASLCLLQGLVSADTTMGYTPAGGVPMATRSGDLDPGVMLALGRQMDGDQLQELVYHGMGLAALAQDCGGDMQRLLASPADEAKFAVQYFCRGVRAGIGALAAKAGGLDALVFTGGIGEHAAAVRAEICGPLGFLGLRLDARENARQATLLQAAGSLPILRLAADEESLMRDLVAAEVDRSGGGARP